MWAAEPFQIIILGIYYCVLRMLVVTTKDRYRASMKAMPPQEDNPRFGDRSSGGEPVIV
jgi:hypothetical protein